MTIEIPKEPLPDEDQFTKYRIPCSYCHGTGTIGLVNRKTGERKEYMCPTCQGSGSGADEIPF